MSDYETWQARCAAGHPDADWSATPTGGPDYACHDCDTGQPPAPVLTPPGAWTYRHQLRRARGHT